MQGQSNHEESEHRSSEGQEQTNSFGAHERCCQNESPDTNTNNGSLFINAPNITSYQTFDGEDTVEALIRRSRQQHQHGTSEEQEQTSFARSRETFCQHGNQHPENGSLFINAPNITSYQTSDGEDTLDRLERLQRQQNAHRDSEGEEQTYIFDSLRGPLRRRNPPAERNQIRRWRPQPVNN